MKANQIQEKPHSQHRILGLSSPYFLHSSGYIYTLNANYTQNKLLTYVGVSGYNFVNLKINGKEIKKRVDKLVASYFVHNPNPEDKVEVIHLDGNNLNDSFFNLKWGTTWQVEYYRLKNELNREAVKEGKKTKEIAVFDIHAKTSIIFKSPKEASEALGITPQKIRKAVRDSIKINNYTFSYT